MNNDNRRVVGTQQHPTHSSTPIPLAVPSQPCTCVSSSPLSSSFLISAQPIAKHTYALIIGISDYQPPWDRLNASINDALAFRAFLTESLHVPPENIIGLFNANATRAGILSGCYELELISEPAGKDACIIIYYAGHGSSHVRPPEWRIWESDSEMVEMMCPVDIGTRDWRGRVVEGIPDRTVCHLLNKLSKLRGNNIVGTPAFHLITC